MADDAESRPGPYLSGTTRHLPAGRDYEYFCDAVADLYVGIRPEVPDGRFDADFALYRLGAAHLGYLSTPGIPASRGPQSLRRLPDDAVFVNFSRADWTLDHLGTAWKVPGGLAFVIDNEQSFRVAWDPARRMRLYSLRIPRSALGPTTAGTVRRAGETVASCSAGRHLATQMSLLATMIDQGAVTTASLMASATVDLVRALLHPGERDAPTRLDRLLDIARGRLGDPAFDLGALARESHWSVRTVQAAFAADGLSFSDWLTGERLELARAMLADPAWEARSVALVARAAGFTDPSTFHRAFRRRFGTTPGSARPGSGQAGPGQGLSVTTAR
jgi:AraC family transcriptional activator of tynA and feaB